MGPGLAAFVACVDGVSTMDFEATGFEHNATEQDVVEIVELAGDSAASLESSAEVLVSHAELGSAMDLGASDFEHEVSASGAAEITFRAPESHADKTTPPSSSSRHDPAYITQNVFSDTEQNNETNFDSTQTPGSVIRPTLATVNSYVPRITSATDPATDTPGGGWSRRATCLGR